MRLGDLPFLFCRQHLFSRHAFYAYKALLFSKHAFYAYEAFLFSRHAFYGEFFVVRFFMCSLVVMFYGRLLDWSNSFMVSIC